MAAPQAGPRPEPRPQYRYTWIVQHYLLPHLGDVPLSALRPEHLDRLYEDLISSGGKDGAAAVSQTVHEAHLIIRNALDLAVQRQFVDRNVAVTVYSPRRRGGGSTVARVWSDQELATFLTFAKSQRLYPALHLAAHTGMRRGEVVGLKWSDLDPAGRRLSIHRTIQSLGGTAVEFGAKTRTSRRSVDLDDTTAASSDAGGTGSGEKDSLMGRTTGCSATPLGGSSNPSPSASSSVAS